MLHLCKTLLRAAVFVGLYIALFIKPSASTAAPTTLDVAPATAEQAINVSDLNPAAEVTIYVDPSHPSASDNNPGTSLLPIKSFSKGVELAINVNKTNTAVRVLVYPGTYRTKVSIYTNYGFTNASMKFEAAQPGTAIISGSSHWTGWEAVSGTGYYSKIWSYNWGLTPIPPSWPTNIPAIARRREMVFIDGVRLTQVSSYSALGSGKFFVDEAADKIYIAPVSSAPITNQFVEVATRSGIFEINGRKNITVRGLVFQHDNTGLDTGIHISESQNVLVENNLFRNNNWGGFGLFTVRNAVTRGNVFQDNGGYGFNAWQLNTFLSENDQSNGNNWRGTLDSSHPMVAWSLAGIKHLNVHGATYRNYRAVDNLTYGLWLDTDMTNIVVENSYLCNNREVGLYLESVRGPVTVRNNKFCSHSNTGVLTANVTNLVFTNNIIYNNKNGIKVSGPIGGRTETDWETGQSYTIPSGSNWTLTDNITMGKSNSQYAFNSTVTVGTSAWNNFLNGLTSYNNIWYNAQSSKVFRLDNGSTYSLSGWIGLTGKDGTSVQGNPLFRNPDAGDFLQIGSTAVANGTGLKGEYFNEMNLTNQVISRPDAKVDFNWGAGSPDSGIGSDTFSVRWTGQVQARYTQKYVFHAVNDDGMRLWVNNRLIINDWDQHTKVDNYGSILLVGGQKYNIRLEWYDNISGAQMRLFWSSARQSEEVIPATNLYTTTSSAQAALGMVELIPNGGFEAADKDAALTTSSTGGIPANDNGLASDWKVDVLSSGDTVVCNDPVASLVAWSGNCAFQFTVDPNEKSSMVYKPLLDAPLQAEALTLSAFVKADSLIGSPFLRVTVRYTDERRARLKVPVVEANGQYVFISGTLPLDGEVKSIKVEVRTKNTTAESGRFFIDDISLITDNHPAESSSTSAPADGLIPLPAPLSSLGTSSSGETSTQAAFSLGTIAQP